MTSGIAESTDESVCPLTGQATRFKTLMIEIPIRRQAGDKSDQERNQLSGSLVSVRISSSRSSLTSSALRAI